MEAEVRTCQNCKHEFTVEPEDFSFYGRIKVPPPTWCPECRMIRRMAWRNYRTIYKRKCDATGEDIISVYSPDKPFKVYKLDYWRQDEWGEPLDYGRPYDFSKPFFQQFRELLGRVPRPSLDQKNAINSDYANYVLSVKNVYLVFAGHHMEDCLYAYSNSAYDKDCMDMYRTRQSEFCYETVSCEKCFRLSFSMYCVECSDSEFLYDCRNCSNCFGCINLRNKQYYVFNKQYSKDEYFEKLKEMDLGSFQILTDTKKFFDPLLRKYPRKFAMISQSENVTGDDISGARNCHYCFFVKDGTENCKYGITLIEGVKDTYDVVGAGLNAELDYETVSAVGQRIMFSNTAWVNHDIQYCDICSDSNNLFGCVGLRNKSYCILNRQCSKEEYKVLVAKIIQHMNTMPYTDKKGRVYTYGEFFPPELSPFAYNETLAQEYFLLARETALDQGYLWKDQEEKSFDVAVLPEDLPDHIKDATDDLVEQVIGCGHHGACEEQCTNAFRLIPQELEFYRTMNLALPRLCPNCRHQQRMKQTNPLKLWHRKCTCAGIKSERDVYENTTKHVHGDGHCLNEFETPYAPERPEIIYCEQCYNSEVA